MGKKLKSRYKINRNDAEVSFTFYYHLGNSLNMDNSSLTMEDVGNGFIKRNWKCSETASYISHSFLDKIVLTHFHISPSALSVKRFSIKINNTEKCYFTLFELSKSSDSFDDSIGAIECTVFKNGYLSVVIRLVNEDKVKDSDLSYFLRQPDRVKKEVEYTSRVNSGEITKGEYDENPGELVILGILLAEQVELLMPSIISKLGIKKIPIETGINESVVSGCHEEFIEMLKERRSRPYVGLVFRLPDSENAWVDEDEDSDFIKKIVVSVGRTTPVFLNGFQNIKSYLGTEERNMYGPGGSIVYIGKRGWCVFDSKKQSAKTFRCGVIEMTHFVIISMTSASRARRRFASYIHSEGKSIFPNLVQSLNEMATLNEENKVATKEEKKKHKRAIKQYEKMVRNATSFLARVNLSSPFDDEHELIEAFLLTHTARNAVRRCAKLSYTNELDSSCKSKISTFQELLKINDAYQKELTKKENRLRLYLAYAGVIFAIVTVANIVADKIT